MPKNFTVAAKMLTMSFDYSFTVIHYQNLILTFVHRVGKQIKAPILLVNAH